MFQRRDRTAYRVKTKPFDWTNLFTIKTDIKKMDKYEYIILIRD